MAGLNHWSFSSGDLPSNVKKNDIRAEVCFALFGDSYDGQQS